ncbi:MAG: helix-turn-helix domain protein [Pelosinus sp.]|jgi:transcriptional regulator with XRE-family HTH domain|nr:helix-turn-helix domain protein [Pelosinus sp.]
MSLGKRLSQLRRDKKLTQEQASKLLNISRSRIALYETDKRDIDTDTLRQFAEFYGVTTDYLLGHELLAVNIKTNFEDLTSTQQNIIFDKIYGMYADEELINKYIDELNISPQKKIESKKLVKTLKITNPQDQSRILAAIVASLDIGKDGNIFANLISEDKRGGQTQSKIYVGNTPIKTEPTSPQLSPDEIALIEKYRRMNDNEKDTMHKVAGTIAPDDEHAAASGK